ncbi:LytTR family DNA-binding domain-containing protein [Dysgonomonas sp. 25]|uniref:LytR/AlgR family response regulator transcription factor n=1 Tax=Dysgonomonas sp. 25 TaxID=2302933 RepID=UPI0013D01047|nr:LytTR family DNA-binding domain-containing protein [Dysgonomonas sp. 25]NDV68878.1 DNA-binding response regulator [Dysgonomonas sp. 25]
MKCIIVDDEPIAREGIRLLIADISQLELAGSFNNAESASNFITETPVDLIFLDINMPGVNGLEFARSIPKDTLVIFTTAYSQYALDSYELDAIGYLIKPIDPAKFRNAVNKALVYHSLLLNEEKKNIDSIEDEYIFVKSDKKYFKIKLSEILFIEGLKDYVIIQLDNQRIISRMSLKTIQNLLPTNIFFRINKSYIINMEHVDSFDNNDIFIGSYEIAIGNSYRNDFLNDFIKNRLSQ